MSKAKIIAAAAALVLVAIIFGVGTGSASKLPVSSISSSSGLSPFAAASSSSSSSSDESVPSEAVFQPISMVPTGSSFSVTFLDVGQGDAAIICCDGRYMIIDGGPSSASQLMYSYCRDAGIENVDYLVATHPDTDHTGGISGALQLVDVDRAFCSVTNADQKSFNSMVKYLGNQGVALEIPKAGDTFALGSANIQIVGPVYNTQDGITNDDSLMLRVTYGSTSFLFTGDATQDEEAASADAGYDLESTVLKVGHHGSAASSSYRFLKAVNPQHSVISVGKANGYGHPTEEALSRLSDCGSAIYRTDLQGDITVTSDGSAVTISTEKNAYANTSVSATEQQTQDLQGISYIGNKNSKKFHLPTCKNLPKESNRVYFDTRQAAVDSGYTPCGNCNP